MAKRIFVMAGIVLIGVALMGMCAVTATPQFWTKLAKQKINRKNWEEALRLADVALNRNLNYAPANLTRAIALLNLARYEECALAAGRAIKNDPDLHLAFVIRAAARDSLGEYEDALADAQTAVKNLPDFPMAHTLHGLALAENGEFERALRAFGRALDLNPDAAETHAALAQTYLCHDKLPKALEHAMTAADFDPGNPKFIHLRGWIFLLSGESDLAIPDLEEAAKQMPHDRAAQMDLGAAYLLAGDEDRARELLIKAAAMEIPSAELKVAQKSPSARKLEEVTFSKTGLSHHRVHFNLALLELMHGDRMEGLRLLALAKDEPPPPTPFPHAVALEQKLAGNLKLPIRVRDGKVVW